MRYAKIGDILCCGGSLYIVKECRQYERSCCTYSVQDLLQTEPLSVGTLSFSNLAFEEVPYEKIRLDYTKIVIITNLHSSHGLFWDLMKICDKYKVKIRF